MVNGLQQNRRPVISLPTSKHPPFKTTTTTNTTNVFKPWGKGINIMLKILTLGGESYLTPHPLHAISINITECY